MTCPKQLGRQGLLAQSADEKDCTSFNQLLVRDHLYSFTQPNVNSLDCIAVIQVPNVLSNLPDCESLFYDQNTVL